MHTTPRWIFTTSIGWIAGIFMTLIFASLFESVGIHHMQFFMGLGMGLPIGFMQWRTAKKHLSLGTSWIWLTTSALTLPFLTFDILKKFTTLNFGDRYILYCIAIACILVGLVQYILLRNRTTNSALWIVANVIGWSLAGLAVKAIDHTGMVSHNNLVLFVLNLLLMLIGGFLLGMALQFFFRWMNKG